MAIVKGSMREVINSIYQILINDEELIRLLYYFPKSDRQPFDPLDHQLPNLINVESEEYWDIVNERFKLAEKTSDLIGIPICRIYISSGRRRPVFGNYLMATQEINISIFTHENYETDMRSEWISDKIQELLSLEYVTGGIGKLDYVAGNPRVAPTQYKRYDQVYEYSSSKR